MAAILTIASGVLGLLAALVSLILGGSIFTALLLWASVGLAATILGIALSMVPHAAPIRARS